MDLLQQRKSLRIPDDLTQPLIRHCTSPGHFSGTAASSRPLVVWLPEFLQHCPAWNQLLFQNFCCSLEKHQLLGWTGQCHLLGPHHPSLRISHSLWHYGCSEHRFPRAEGRRSYGQVSSCLREHREERHAKQKLNPTLLYAHDKDDLLFLLSKL